MKKNKVNIDDFIFENSFEWSNKEKGEVKLKEGFADLGGYIGKTTSLTINEFGTHSENTANCPLTGNINKNKQ